MSGDVALEIAWETALESHFRLGIAVHRAECLLAALSEAVRDISPDGDIDLVDTALLGNTCPDARLSTLIVTAFGATASAIALWHGLAFHDPVVSALLGDHIMTARFERCRSAVCHGGGIATDDLAAMTEDFPTHLTWALDVTAAMRAPLRCFGETHFPRAVAGR
jgi:hypothetical protein